MRLKTNHWLAIGALGLSAVWLLSGVIMPDAAETEEAAAPAPLRVVVQTLDYRESAGGIVISGRTEANHSGTAQARAAGVIVELAVAEGDIVSRGQTIARLSDEARTEAVREAEARVSQARGAFEAAEGLAEDGFYPRLQLDQRRAELAAAQAGLDRARAEAARGVVTSPVAGVVDRLIAEPGEAVQIGAEVAAIADLDPIVAAGSISARERNSVSVGAPATVTLPDGRQLSGQVRFLAPTADAATATYRLEVEIPNPDRDVLAGEIAEIRVEGSGLSRAAQIERSAVTLNEAGVLGVKYVDDADTVVFAAVDIVRDDPDGLWISGPPAGAAVIVRGQEYAKAGARVEPVRGQAMTADGRS